MVKKLLYAGAKPDVRDGYNITALDWAKKENNVKFLSVFHKHLSFTDNKKKANP